MTFDSYQCVEHYPKSSMYSQVKLLKSEHVMWALHLSMESSIVEFIPKCPDRR